MASPATRLKSGWCHRDASPPIPVIVSPPHGGARGMSRHRVCNIPPRHVLVASSGPNDAHKHTHRHAHDNNNIHTCVCIHIYMYMCTCIYDDDNYDDDDDYDDDDNDVNDVGVNDVYRCTRTHRCAQTCMHTSMSSKLMCDNGFVVRACVRVRACVCVCVCVCVCACVHMFVLCVSGRRSGIRRAGRHHLV